MNEEKNISKIKLSDKVYEIKDAEVRYILDVLLGKCPNEDTISSENKA